MLPLTLVSKEIFRLITPYISNRALTFPFLIFIWISYILQHRFYWPTSPGITLQKYAPRRVVISPNTSPQPLPSSVTQIKFKLEYPHSPLIFFHPCITHATFFNKDLPVEQLPASITHLKLKYFDGPVDFLPENLISLKISSTHFTHPIDHLPSTLIHLTVSHKKNAWGEYLIIIDYFVNYHGEWLWVSCRSSSWRPTQLSDRLAILWLHIGYLFYYYLAFHQQVF